VSMDSVDEWRMQRRALAAAVQCIGAVHPAAVLIERDSVNVSCRVSACLTCSSTWIDESCCWDYRLITSHIKLTHPPPLHTAISLHAPFVPNCILYVLSTHFYLMSPRY